MIDRIVILNDLSQAAGGASLLAKQSAVELARRGVRTTFLSGDVCSETDEWIDYRSLGQERLIKHGPLKSLFRGIHNSAAADFISEWIRENDTPRTVYHLHGWMQIFSPAVFRALSPVLDRLVITAHDFFLTCPNGASFDYSEKSVCTRKPLGRSCVLARCDRRNHAHKVWRLARQFSQKLAVDVERLPLTLLIHEGMRELLEQGGLDSRKMVTLPNPVVPYTNHRIQAENNSAVLFVGRMEQTKGVDLAARACRRAGVHFIGLGDGALLERMRVEFPEFEFPGKIEKDSIGLFASRSRLLVMPSLHMEPFGLSGVEAMWSGLPVIASNQSLITRDIERSGAGWGIDPEDTQDFAGKLSTLVHDDALARKMSFAAFQDTDHLALPLELWIDGLLASYRAVLDDEVDAVGERFETLFCKKRGVPKISSLVEERV